MFAGYTSRLLKEMKRIYEEKTLGNVADKTIKIDINIDDAIYILLNDKFEKEIVKERNINKIF